MKKAFVWIPAFLLTVFAAAMSVSADPGEMGFWGGVTSGVRLPKATEVIMADGNAATDETTIYKEMIFLGGVPVEFEGQMERTGDGPIPEDENFGSYTESYAVSATAATAQGVSLTRDVDFDVTWVRNGKQVVYNFAVTAWDEAVTVNGVTYELDEALSSHEVTVIQDTTPGVSYYSGSQSMRAVYMNGDAQTVVERNGEFYRYECAWSKSEVHNVSSRVMNADGWQLSYDVRPSASAFKTLIQHTNDPLLISFPGNLQEVYQVESGLVYDIYDMPARFYGVPLHGTASIAVQNVFENLFAIDTAFLNGHPAQEEIRRLYALEVLDGQPEMFQPNQAITRSQFFVMLAKALKLPLDQPAAASARGARGAAPQIVAVFPDVGPDRPDYPYIMAAFKAGIAVGKGGSLFYPDDMVTLEEAIHTIVSSLGLLNLGLDPTNMTQFADDGDIGGWAKPAIYAAARIGLIGADPNGNINPKVNINKAMGAALVNRMIEYMRVELKSDYSEHEAHFAG